MRRFLAWAIIVVCVAFSVTLLVVEAAHAAPPSRQNLVAGASQGLTMRQRIDWVMEVPVFAASRQQARDMRGAGGWAILQLDLEGNVLWAEVWLSPIVMRPLLNPRHWDPYAVAYAVWVVGHEHAHVTGIIDEELADCRASSDFYDNAAKLGINFPRWTVRSYFGDDRCHP